MTKNLGPRDAAVLESLAQHRVMTTDQIRRLHFPNDAWPKEAQLSLQRLAKLGFAQPVRASDGGGHRHFATPVGRKVAGVDPRTHQMTAEVAAGPYALGPLGANEVGIAFVAAARSKEGHECSHLDWEHEVLHRLGSGPQNKVVPDAVLRYADEHGVLERFVEYDRGTYNPDRLRRKILGYALLCESGKWRSMGYLAVPKLIVVFDDRMPRCRQLRMDQVVQLCATDSAIQRASRRRVEEGRLDVSLTFLSQLRERGPWAPIFRQPGSEHLVDLLGEPPLRAVESA